MDYRFSREFMWFRDISIYVSPLKMSRKSLQKYKNTKIRAFSAGNTSTKGSYFSDISKA